MPKSEPLGEFKRNWGQMKFSAAIELWASGCTSASTGEHVAAAFVLNCQDHLPDAERDLIKAWDSLGHTWQAHVRCIKRDYLHLIDAGWLT